MSASGQPEKYPARFNDLTWYRTNVPCMEACPVHTDSGRYVQLIAEGRHEEAFLTARAPNPLASICGRVCAAPCEDACRRGVIDEAVAIRPLKRFVTEQFGAESARPDFYRHLLEDADAGTSSGFQDAGCRRAWHLSQLNPNHATGMAAGEQTGRKVAVIGSGPAGLACAHDLAILGADVTVFEALDHAGGMLRYGVPEYRLPRGVIEREVGIIEDLGVTLRTGTALTEEYHLGRLREEGFEAFFISVGAMQGRDLNIPGSERDGVVKAVDYLLNINRGYRVDLGERVVVIGGGSVALDAARSAIRDFYQPMEEIEMTARAVVGQPAMDAARGALRGGATEVHVVSLESLAEMPAALTVQGREELDGALVEGIHLHPAWGPKEITGGEQVSGIELVACTRVFNEQGRFDPQFDDSTTMALEADAVILAVGQRSDFSFLREEDGVEIAPTGTITIDPETLATSAAGIYAGGDAAFGPRIAIEAVANGKRAARSIHEFLGGRERKLTLQVDISRLETTEYRMPEGYEKRDRQMPDSVELERRTGITEVEHAFNETEARVQAERCLACHIDTIYDPLLCVLCGRCADVCPEGCLKFVPLDQVDIPEDQLRLARCPTDAMTMERFNFIETME